MAAAPHDHERERFTLGRGYGTCQQRGGSALAAKVPDSTRDMAVHKMTGRETLEGLSIMYDVPIRDILAANKLWARDDIHTRAFLYIPRRVAKHPPLATAPPPAETAEMLQEKQDKLDAAIADFRRATGEDAEVARFYVEAYPCSSSASGHNVVKALQQYREDVAAGLISGRTTSPSRRPLLDDVSDEDSTPPARPAALPPRHKLPQLQNFIDTFYDL